MALTTSNYCLILNYDNTWLYVWQTHTLFSPCNVLHVRQAGGHIAMLGEQPVQSEECSRRVILLLAILGCVLCKYELYNMYII